MPSKEIQRSFTLSDSPIQLPSLISNDLCQMVLEPAHGGDWIVDLTGITTCVNASMAHMIGYARKEMIERSYFERRKQGTEIDAIESTMRETTRADSKSIELENLVLDPNTFEVRVNGKVIEISAFSFKLLQYLLDNANRLISRQEFLEKVWKDPSLADRVIDSHIVALRKKLRGFRGEIKTVYGVGYILKINPRGRQ